MHNRTRMVVASFLVKDLHLEWQHGANFFMEHLVDFDVASNSHGCNGQPDAAQMHPRITESSIQLSKVSALILMVITSENMCQNLDTSLLMKFMSLGLLQQHIKMVIWKELLIMQRSAWNR